MWQSPEICFSSRVFFVFLAREKRLAINVWVDFLTSGYVLVCWLRGSLVTHKDVNVRRTS